MAATKLQFKYGSWSSDDAKALSKQFPGLVVFNYGDHTIYVGNNAFGMNDEEVTELLKRVATLEEFRKALYVAGYAQATMTEGENDYSSLTIFGIKQGEEDSDKNNGKIAHDATNDLVINFAAKYDKDTNKVALQSNLTDLKKEILGTLDPEELEKTLDTIREIQEQLVNGAWRIDYTKDGVTTTVKTTRYPVKTDPITIGGVTYPVGSVVWTDGTDPIEDATVYASLAAEVGAEIKYTDGYSNLRNLGNIDKLVANIENLEKKDYINELKVNENDDKDFVTASSETSTDDYGAKSQSIKIGVNYGTFKTGHGNVMDETSTAFVDGIATVEAVQKYIEERLTWVSFETDAATVATTVSETPEGGTYAVTNDSNDLNNSLLIKSNN